MSRKLSPRYGLTADTGVATPTGNRSTLSGGNDTKPHSSNQSANDETLRDAIDTIDQFQKTTPRRVKSSRQKRDDYDIKDGPGSNRHVDTSTASSPGHVGEVETVYRPRFFNYEPASPSPRSNTKSEGFANNGSVVEDSKQSPSLTSPQTQASPRVKPTPRWKTKTPKTTRHNKQTNSNLNSTLTFTNIPPSSSDSNHDIILPSPSSASFKTTSQLQRLMRTPGELVLRKKKQPKQSIPLNVICTEDGGFEVHESGRNIIESDRVYRVKNSVKYGVKGILTNSSIATKESVDEQLFIGTDELGKNGWHRLLEAWSEEEAGQQKNKQSSFSPEAASTLDQLSAIHILQHSLSAFDEYDALREERSCLLREIRALEKDRLCLERMFHDIEKDIEKSYPQSGQQKSKKHALSWDYKDFKENMRRIDREDRKYLPLMWLEELAVKENAFLDDGVDAKRKGKRRTTHKVHADDVFSKEMVEKIRRERGNGLALLLSDVNAKNSLIGRCYMSSLGKGNSDRILSTEGPSIIIPNGGIGVRYFGVTGSKTNVDAPPEQDGDAGTSYFIKFDTGKSFHRGMLPANLLDRLEREDRDSRSLRYLSTGPPSADVNTYYAEFDDGECWWVTTPSQFQEDDELHQIFTNMDVHRVAFGMDSSWIVISKDGEVVWKNIPQDLHDVMASRDSTSMAAPCDVSLGIGGSFFIRFLDGSIQYSLPSFVADVCERLDSKSQLVCNVSLNVNTYDCLIRYSSKD